MNNLKEFLNEKAALYNRPDFIINDPVCIPHLFIKKQDIEIAGFFAAIFAWGNRKIIINKSKVLMGLMDNQPYDFCLYHSAQDLKRLLHFKHRTFNATDLLYFVQFLKQHYQQYVSLEDAFILNRTPANKGKNIEDALTNFHKYFFSLQDFPERTKKHIATPAKKSNCKRLNMFLRWMVRKDNNGVDFGIWDKMRPADLICPVDVHVARVAKRLQLLERKQTDWLTATELTERLKTFDPKDPCKYDFALFGLGVIEKYY